MDYVAGLTTAPSSYFISCHKGESCDCQSSHPIFGPVSESRTFQLSTCDLLLSVGVNAGLCLLLNQNLHQSLHPSVSSSVQRTRDFVVFFYGGDFFKTFLRHGFFSCFLGD